MQVSFKDMLESQDYQNQKRILFNSINRTQKNELINGAMYAPSSTIPYIDRTMHVEREVFKKSDEEKQLLYNLKKELPKTRTYKFVTFTKATF